MSIFVFHQQNVGLPEEVCLCRYPGPPAQHHLRLLEVGLGDELLLCHYAHKPSGEKQGTCCAYVHVTYLSCQYCVKLISLSPLPVPDPYNCTFKGEISFEARWLTCHCTPNMLQLIYLLAAPCLDLAHQSLPFEILQVMQCTHIVRLLPLLHNNTI